MKDSEQRVESYVTKGFYPVRWAHHPPEIKAAIRAGGFRPLLKRCYRNCQLLMVYNDSLGLGLGLEYHEGWAQRIIPFEHAWLIYKGKVLDLTLDDMDERDYCASTAYTIQEVKRSMVVTKTFTPLTSPRGFGELHPLRDQFEALRTMEG